MKLIVSNNDVDEIIQQYSQYIDETVAPRCSDYTNFCVSTSRLDELLFDTMADNSSEHKLWSCMRMLLLLSHGQADSRYESAHSPHVKYIYLKYCAALTDDGRQQSAATGGVRGRDPSKDER